MNNRFVDTYWHWADMEQQERDWAAQFAAANKGLERCGEDPRLLVMSADAVNRIAYGLRHLQRERSVQEHERALQLFQRALTAARKVRADRDTLSRTYGGLARVSRVLGQATSRERYLAAWEQAVPDDERLALERRRGPSGGPTNAEPRHRSRD